MSGAAPRRFLVSATHKSSGKTTVAIGLAAALARRSLEVQPFKKGPDFIDPMWLTQASGRRCRNLDPYLTGEDEIRASFARHAAGAGYYIKKVETLAVEMETLCDEFIRRQYRDLVDK